MSLQLLTMFIPSIALLLLIGIEIPRQYKLVFFKIPLWLSSTVIAIAIGAISRGVFGPAAGFLGELVMFPGFYIIKKHTLWAEKRAARGVGVKKRCSNFRNELHHEGN